MATDKLTSDGERLVKAWLGAQEQLATAKSMLNRSECDLANSQNALAKWMLPADAKPGEKIAVWHGDALIQVQVPAEGSDRRDPVVTIRSRGKATSGF